MVPVVVFNPLNWDRKIDLARVTVRFDKGKVTLPGIFDADGNELSSEVIENGQYDDGSIHMAEILCVVKDIPSIGYNTFYAGQTESKADSQSCKWQNNILENDFYKIEFCPFGIKSIVDKKRDIELISTDKFYCGEFFIGKDTGLYTEPDKLDLKSYFERMKDNPAKIEMVRNTPVRATILLSTRFADCDFREYVSLYKDIAKITIDTELNWPGTHQRQVRMAMPFDIANAQMAYEVPFGVVEIGKDEFPGPDFWQAKKDEPYVEWNPYHIDIFTNAHRTSREVQNFFDISGQEIGVFVNSTVVTHDYRDKSDNPADYPILQPVLLATKLCSGRKIWHEQKGVHKQSFDIRTHEPGWRNGYKKGWEFNNPPISVVPVTNLKANLPSKYSFMSIKPDNIIVSTMKKCEDDDSVVIRVFEQEGKDVKARLHFFKPIGNLLETNIIERQAQPLKEKPNSISLGHNEIKTLKFELKE